MSTRRDEGVAGYHIYVTVDPTRADTAGLGRRRGPLRDAAGAVVRAPLEVDVAQLAARLPVGTVELVPVDAAGTELAHEPLLDLADSASAFALGF